MKTGGIHFIVALIMFGYAIYILFVSNDIYHLVMTCTIVLFNTILGAIWVIIEKIDSK